MALPILVISKNWFTGTTVQETNWDRIRTPLLDWAARINLAFQQVTLDAFGSYSISNTGAPSLSVSLQDQITSIVSGTSSVLGTAGNTWTVHLGSAGNAILSATGLTGSRTFTFPDATDVLAGTTAVQTLTGKTLTTPTIASFVNSTHNHQDAAGGGSLATSAISSGTFADARIASSNVTQHQASLSLAASQIASGTFADARVASSNVTQHQAALAINSSQITFSEILLPNTDPPTANYGSRKSFGKGWAAVSGAGSDLNSFNVSSVTRLSLGRYQIFWDTNFANVNYACCASINYSGSAVAGPIISIFDQAVDYVLVGIQFADGTNTDQEFSIMAFGDQ